MKKVIFAFVMIGLCSNSWAGSKALMTVIGAGAGFGVGMLVGFSKYDQAINSEQKIWTSSLVGATAGGVAGYFIGRHMDHKKQSAANLPPVMQPIKFDFVRDRTDGLTFDMGRVRIEPTTP